MPEQIMWRLSDEEKDRLDGEGRNLWVIALLILLFVVQVALYVPGMP